MYESKDIQLLWLILFVYYKFVLTLMENTNVDEEIILFYMELRYNGATLLILWMIWIHTTCRDFLQLRILTHNIRRLLRRFEMGEKGAIGCGSFFLN